MVLKLMVFMVAVAVLEGVAGLQEKQFANETQINANPDHKKRGRRLDKLPCIVEGGTCQPKGEPCDGVVRQGPEWCLHHRHFECCYPYGCEMDGVVCPNGAIAEKNCIILICQNGCWEFVEWNLDCGFCYTYNYTTIVPYQSSPYIFTGDTPGIYRFTGGFGLPRSGPQQSFGIDIGMIRKSIPDYSCINNVLYFEPGLTIMITISTVLEIKLAFDWGPIINYQPNGNCGVKTISTGLATVCIYTDDFGNIYIIGSYGLSVYVDYIGTGPCFSNVYAMATPSLQGDLYGLCDVWTNDLPYPVTPYPVGDYTDSKGVETDDTNAFVDSWMLPVSRKRHNKFQAIKNLPKDHTLQVTDPPIIEKSMSDIVKSCEEMNEGPCSVLSSEECEILQESCVFTMSNVDIPGQGGSSDSSE